MLHNVVLVMVQTYRTIVPSKLTDRVFILLALNMEINYAVLINATSNGGHERKEDSSTKSTRGSPSISHPMDSFG